MKKKLNVWGSGMLSIRQAAPSPNGSRQVRVVGAFPSAVAFARAIGESVYFVKNYAGITGNAAEIAQAMTEPGTMFYRDENGDKQWHKLTLG